MLHSIWKIFAHSFNLSLSLCSFLRPSSHYCPAHLCVISKVSKPIFNAFSQVIYLNCNPMKLALILLAHNLLPVPTRKMCIFLICCKPASHLCKPICYFIHHELLFSIINFVDACHMSSGNPSMICFIHSIN